MAYRPVTRTLTKRFGGAAELRMAVSKAVSIKNADWGKSALTTLYTFLCFIFGRLISWKKLAVATAAIL